MFHVYKFYFRSLNLDKYSNLTLLQIQHTYLYNVWYAIESLAELWVSLSESLQDLQCNIMANFYVANQSKATNNRNIAKKLRKVRKFNLSNNATIHVFYNNNKMNSANFLRVKRRSIFKFTNFFKFQKQESLTRINEAERWSSWTSLKPDYARTPYATHPSIYASAFVEIVPTAFKSLRKSADMKQFQSK